MRWTMVGHATFIAVSLTLFSANCACLSGQDDKSIPAAVEEPTVERDAIGQTGNVTRIGDLYFSGQFQPSAIKSLKEKGIERVICLRGPDELTFDEQKLLEDAGMEFVLIPLTGPDALTDETIDLIRAELASRNGKTLLHCGSAVRVAAAWLPYRIVDERVDAEKALEEAMIISPVKSQFLEKALDYVARKKVMPPPATEGKAEEESVKPDINRDFLDPNLDVDEFVQRFEMESREVFVARERILAACELQKGMRVADVGAGTGLFSRMFSVAVGETGSVFAVDISPRFLEHINEESAKFELSNITAVLGTARSISLPTESVDVVFVCDTYHHFEFPRTTLSSIGKALKSGGRLVVVDFERIPGQSREWTLNHVRADKETVIREITDAGFQLEEEVEAASLTENYLIRFVKK